MGKIGFWQSGKAAPVNRDDDFDRLQSVDLGEFGARPVSNATLNPLEASLILKAYEDSGQGWFWATDQSGRLTYLTARIAPVLTEQPGKLVGTPFADLFLKGDEGFGAGRNLPFMLTRQSKFENIVVRATDSPDTHLWSVSGTPQYDAQGQFVGFRGSGVDITEQRKSSEHTSRLAMYDSLTGLPNRLRAAQVLDGELKRLKVHKRPCAVLMLDLDRFKQVNDTLGHPAGDALLKQVADRLLRIVGDKERVFRLGGDEFQVILRNGDDRDAIHELGTRIITSLSQPYSVEGSRCIIGASIGVALSPAEGCSSDDLIRNADLALYAAKDSGRGCVSFFSSELLQDAEDRRALEDDLRDALAKGEMHVFYQPIVNAQTNVTTGVEALVRWHHPERGSISPALFIPIAEEANLIGPLGEWILRKACEDAASWPGSMTVAVNVSPMQFANGSLPAVVTSALASSGLSPDRLELEITEGVFLSDGAAADNVFTELKQIGVRLALDDFGTGYSSLGYLRTAPFDKIKIDQSFVRAATLPGSRNSAIIAAIVALAEALGMETTAEGIESHDQLELIQGLRVSHVQGYIYSQAIASDELIERLASGDWVIPPSGPSQQRSERFSLYRKVRAIFGNHYRYVLIRNLSETGALVEGLDDVPCGSHLIIDFGEGHLVFARIVRSRNRQQGIEFEQRLVSDGRGGLLTPNPVSPYTIQKAGLPGLGATETPQAPAPDNAARMETLRAKLGLAAAPAPGQGAGEHLVGMSGAKGQPGADAKAPTGPPSRDLHERPLTSDEIGQLQKAAEASANPQLKFIVALLILTGVRQRDLLEARWDQFDLDQRVWVIPSPKAGKERRVQLSQEAIDVIGKLPRWDDCPYLIANPATQKPYRSFATSWDTARIKAGLDDVEIDDLRFCNVDRFNRSSVAANDMKTIVKNFTHLKT